jgi:hypothetical protein
MSLKNAIKNEKNKVNILRKQITNFERCINLENFRDGKDP